MPTCPNGHPSMADDWCEVCGHRMQPAAGGPLPVPGYPAPPPPVAGPPPQQPGATAHTESCPRCHTPRTSPGPYCEECRYNFATSRATAYLPPQSAHGAPPPGYPAPPAPPPFPQPGYPQEAPQHAAPRPEPTGDWMLPPPTTPPPPPPGPPPSADPRAGGYGGTGGGGWMVTIGPDHAYFAAMMHRSGPEAAQLSLPSYAPEQQVRLVGRQMTIGRRRQSSGATPDIDLGRAPEDPGVSHQHAVLVQQPDGSWAVVDQDSTNGTTVNGSEEPIQPFVPVPLAEGDLVHVGAWTTLRVHRG
ncbi:FHA domain-containing protein [Streptomyces bohaiensis]|uniref:FHA domain-containing protein n=2 Tax=Streptomyces bohaiensis TaxID=1431344 RepID=UPI003B81AD28